MKKIKLFFLLLSGILVFPQDSVAVEPVQMEAQTVYTADYQPEYETLPPQERLQTRFENRQWKEGFKENYKGKKFDYEEKEIKYTPPLFQLPAGLLQVLMYVVLGTILLIIIYFILRNAGGFSFGKEKRKINYQDSGESEAENLEEIQNNDFERLIQKAKSESDYRKAVRYYHLWVLQKLSERNLIRWDKDKTDFDYLQELKNHPIRPDFSSTTYVYDYTWYGHFRLDDREFELAEKLFRRTLKKIS